MSKRTTTAMAEALKAAAAKMPAKAAPAAKPVPLQVITGRQIGETRKGDPKMDIWLSYQLLNVLTEKYGDDVEAFQRGANWLVETGRVKIPDGWSLKVIKIKAFGGKISVLAEDPAMAWSPKAPKAMIDGLPD